jgi:hypothetical protein
LRKIEQFYKKEEPFTITIGIVVSVNDPQQLGRIQVMIPSLGHTPDQVERGNLPWANYSTPYGGVDSLSTRGVATDGQSASGYGTKSSGPIAYGQWAIPKVNARVLLCTVDKDLNQIYWFGCIYQNSMTHTMPHGRFSAAKLSDGPDGPLSSTEQPIEPYYSNSVKAFGGHNTFEWRSRGADYSGSAISPTRANKDIALNTAADQTGTVSAIADDRDAEITEADGNVLGHDLKYRQGYALSRIDPALDTTTAQHVSNGSNTDANLEPSVMSFTTPGFHAISMDDRPENCRVRLRTTSGHQILLDDTNERIYISTSEGRNWVEMDTDGHIYIFSEESISLKATGDINLSADKSIRMTAKKGIFMYGEDDIRIETTKDLHAKSINQFIEASTAINITSQSLLIKNTNFDISSSSVKLSTDTLDLLCSGNLVTKASTVSISSSNMNVDSGGNLKMSGDVSSGSHSLDTHTHKYKPGPGGPIPSDPPDGGPVGASPGSPATANTAEPSKQAYWTNIVPQHEPWARTYKKDSEININHTDEFPYDSPEIAVSMKRSGVEDTRKRNPLWHR